MGNEESSLNKDAGAPWGGQSETVPRVQYDAVMKENAELQKQLAQMKAATGQKFPSEMTNGTRGLECPMGVMTDSYKATHFHMYPECRSMTAYGEFRAQYKGVGVDDDRFIFYGMRHCIENLVARRWTRADVEAAEAFYSTHNAGATPYPFPKDLFLKFIDEHDGYFPVVIEALPEGTVAYVRTPVFIITAEGEYSRLCTFLETVLDMVWYPSCVATLSRFVRDVIEEAFVQSVDEELFWLADSRLHDFGFRGCTCVEQSVLGGAAHLLNFGGSDTMSACYHVQYHLNGGRPVGSSIPATEHSVMTAWPSEEAAMLNEIDKYGHSLYACVMDSYDYDYALNTVLPKVADKVKEKGGVIVLRPDSGDPMSQVLKGLKAAEATFGASVNKKGYKLLNNSAVIQGDGVNYNSVKEILEGVMKEGYAATNVAFGMGGGLLQKMNRDTMSFATKLSHIVYEDGTERDVMKTPKSSSAKISLPGRLFVGRVNGVPTVFPQEDPACKSVEPVMRVVYNKGPVAGAFEDFDDVRARVKAQWAALPKKGPCFSATFQAKIDRILAERHYVSEG
eukprot:CAMPEP_0181308900 /NCGR_PEP_ID=MMETSP1101-20121128/11726_1 /TAXON_ID=46948 /ORGANISM="Rhodomonas abbreviata, Strain Caron Lab Isolate" /LENGTH=563 /DNA_ID=CAMNT_0023415347 /DNA_START=161 /DNA_END=1852 /DNA_ORIENTATION=+